MDNLALTIIAAVILMALVIIALAVGLLVTGKSRLRRGCGLVPSKDPKKTTTTCPICGEEKVCKKQGEENDIGNLDGSKK